MHFGCGLYIGVEFYLAPGGGGGGGAGCIYRYR